MSTLAVVYCRPQNPTKLGNEGVQIEKQHIIEVLSQPRTLFENTTEKEKIIDNTKEILEKIAQVNKNHGLTPKGLKADYIQVPTIYSRSQDYLKHQERHYNDFGFNQNPFTNPIFDYLRNDQTRAQNKNPSGDVLQDDEVPGQYIKRKITHSQTIIVPTYLPSAYIPMQVPNQPPVLNINQSVTNQSLLEKQTVDNIKNIMVAFQPFYAYQNFVPYQNPYFQYPSVSFNRNPVFRQQITSPFGEFFPITIRDPVMQMLNAFTSMIEYGPGGSPPNKCKTLEDDSEKLQSSRFGKLLSPTVDLKSTINYNIQNKDENPEITIFGVENQNLSPENELNQTVLDIEDLQINNNSDDPVQFSYNFKADSFDWVNKDRDAKVVKKETKRVTVSKPGGDSRGSPPNRDHPVDVEDDEVNESEVVLDSEISKDDQKNGHETTNKKLISKDNTGSGIFIHKLKVRKGGVAIAGPGGIATAGSGGTAIVGPNGFAYTHPDSIAIAGSGSQVIAVDPQISLSDIIQNQNKTRKDGSRPRIGKVVAIGPVIYYNKGQNN